MKSSRNYYLLLAGQFLGAFGDNFLLKAILGPLTYMLTAGTITEQQVNEQNTLFSAVFFIPFILLAPVAGYLNDRMPKNQWLRRGNALKFIGTLVGFAGVWWHAGDFHASRLWQVAGYTIVGIGACVYSPAKYGVLPEILPAERLVKANGSVEMLTLVAILAGYFCGAQLYDHTRSLPLCYGASLGLYAAAFVLNFMMDRTPHNASATLRHSVGEFATSLRSMLTHPRLGRILLGSGLFWFAGSILRNNMQTWGLRVFQQAGVADITNQKLVFLIVAMTLGIVAGSVLAGQLHKIGDLTWSRRYGFLMALGILLLGMLGGKFGLFPVVVALIGTGVVSGLLLVPFNAALQHESDHTKLGKTIAIQNFVDYFAMLIGAGFLALLTRFNFNPLQVFLTLPVALALISLTLRMPPEKPASPGA